MESIIKLQNELAEKYNYQKLNTLLSVAIRQKYQENLPDFLCMDGAKDELYSLGGTLITKGYQRIVIGDYGAFIEFNQNQAASENFKIQKGQEYRMYDTKYSPNVKYIWLTTKDESDVKIYQQLKTVSYADYKVGMYYVSPYEVMVQK